MKRRSFRQMYDTPDAILTGDWHITEEIPLSRVDDFLLTQKRKLLFIKKLQIEYGCPILHSGDVFDYWKVNPFLISFAIQYFPRKILGVYGNHDLPRHSFKLRNESALYALEKAGIFKIAGVSYGLNPDDYSDDDFLLLKNRRILVWHTFVYKSKREHWYDSNATHARSILRKYSNFDLIITGDNHQEFVEEYNGRLLVNPGCLLRERLTEKDYEPAVYFWYARSNRVVRIPIPFDSHAVQDERLNSLLGRNKEREFAFIERVKSLGSAVAVDFRSNLVSYFRKNKVVKSIETIVFKAIESDQRSKYDE